MIKRLLPLALALACVPPAYAFPPCPLTEIEYIPLEEWSPSQSNDQPWFQTTYTFAGAPAIIDGLKSRSPDIHGSGKCGRDVAPPLENYISASGGIIQLDPSYAPEGGLGLVALPEIPVVAEDGMRITYELEFTVDNRPLAQMEDWLDLVQLEFSRDNLDGVVSSVFRVRKTQPGNGAARLEVIASRSLRGADGQWQKLLDAVVATVPLAHESGHTPIALRWAQHAYAREPGAHQGTASGTTGAVELGVTSVLQVIGANETHEFTLPSQWASAFSMGLLDYTIEKAENYHNDSLVRLDKMTLKAYADGAAPIPAPPIY